MSKCEKYLWTAKAGARLILSGGGLHRTEWYGTKLKDYLQWTDLGDSEDPEDAPLSKSRSSRGGARDYRFTRFAIPAGSTNHRPPPYSTCWRTSVSASTKACIGVGSCWADRNKTHIFSADPGDPSNIYRMQQLSWRTTNEHKCYEKEESRCAIERHSSD